MNAYRTSGTQKRSFWRSKGFLLVVIVVAIAGWGIFARIHAESDLNRRTEDLAVPSVVTIKAPSGPATEEIVLPGTVQAWHEAPIFARTNGYLKYWKTDIGAHVKAGDLLAEIDTPDVDAQLHQAAADMATAKANNDLAQITAKRWVQLLKTNSVSKQETDEKIGDAAAKAAALASARANLDRLQQLEGFKRVVAPFAGVVTARNTDTGALINAGSTPGAGQELFHVADIHKLRIYTQVPETYIPVIGPGLKANLQFAEHPGVSFPASFVQSAHALDVATRTLLVEFAVDNTKGELVPGGFTDVHMQLDSQAGSVRLPVNALIFRSAGLEAATVDSDGKALLKPIKIGRDFGKEVEVVSGVEPGEPIILNPPDSLMTGQKVRIVDAAAKENEEKSKEKTADKKEEGSSAKKSKAAPDDSIPGEVKPKKDDSKDDKKP